MFFLDIVLSSTKLVLFINIFNMKRLEILNKKNVEKLDEVKVLFNLKESRVTLFKSYFNLDLYLKLLEVKFEIGNMLEVIKELEIDSNNNMSYIKEINNLMYEKKILYKDLCKKLVHSLDGNNVLYGLSRNYSWEYCISKYIQNILNRQDIYDLYLDTEEGQLLKNLDYLTYYNENIKTDNNLSESVQLIDESLENKLYEIGNLKLNRSKPELNPDLYLVKFNFLFDGQGNQILIYKYIRYSMDLNYCLISYIIGEYQKDIRSLKDLFICDIYFYNLLDYLKDDIIDSNFFNAMNKLTKYNHIQKLYKESKGIPILNSIDDIVGLLSNFRKEHKKFNRLDLGIKNNQNTILNMVFLIHDFNNLIVRLKEINSNTNQGPQK